MRSRALAGDAQRFTDGVAVVGVALAAQESAVIRGSGLKIIESDPALRTMEVSGTPTALTRFAKAAATDMRVRYVEPLQHARSDHQRNDPYTFENDPSTGMPYEWNFAAVGMDKALNVAPGSSDILVGVEDSGVANVPDLAGKIAETWYFPFQGPDAVDTEGHGTFVSSLIAANNDDGVGMAGFCGACRLVVFKDVPGTIFTFATAVQKLVDEHVRVLNLSLDFPFPSYLVTDAINYAINAGVLPVISTGNDGVGAVAFPASYVQPVNGALGYGLAVGASDVSGNRAVFSNWGSNLSLVAPGTYDGTTCSRGVFGAVPAGATEFSSGTCGVTFPDATGNSYAYWSGTSFSAPEVAGIAALVWSTNESLKSYQVASILEQTATRPVGAAWEPLEGWGGVNAAAAIAFATGRSTADSLAVDGLSVGLLKAGTTATATAQLAWGDGASVLEDGTTECQGAGAGIAFNVAGSVSQGVATCAFAVPKAAGGNTVGITMTATVGGVSGSESLSSRVTAVAVKAVAKKKSETKEAAKPRAKHKKRTPKKKKQNPKESNR